MVHNLLQQIQSKVVVIYTVKPARLKVVNSETHFLSKS